MTSECTTISANQIEGARGLNFLIAFVPLCNTKVYSFDCLHCARTFGSFDDCFDPRHPCLKILSNKLIKSNMAPDTSSPKHKSPFHRVFPIQVERARDSEVAYKRFWTLSDLKTHTELVSTTNNEKSTAKHLRLLKRVNIADDEHAGNTGYFCWTCYSVYRNRRAARNCCSHNTSFEITLLSEAEAVLNVRRLQN